MALIASVAIPLVPVPALADTLQMALIQAYQNNPSLNSQRAGVRATDESVPQALSGYRPTIAVTAVGGEQTSYSQQKLNTPAGLPAVYNVSSGYNAPLSAGITAT